MTEKYDYDSGNSVGLILKAQAGDSESLKKMVEINTPLVKAMVRRYNSFKTDREDLLQIGYIGLIKAVKGFDPSYNVRFSTYAVPLIIGEIKRYMRDEGAVKIARSVKELNRKIRCYCENFAFEHGTDATVEDICRGLNCSRESVLEAIESGYAAVSLEQPVFSDGSCDTLLNHLEAKKEPEWLDILQLRECLKELTKEEKQIISMRYYSNLTQSSIAGQLGMSQVQVSRMESRILRKLRAKMK